MRNPSASDLLYLYATPHSKMLNYIKNKLMKYVEILIRHNIAGRLLLLLLQYTACYFSRGEFNQLCIQALLFIYFSIGNVKDQASFYLKVDEGYQACHFINLHSWETMCEGSQRPFTPGQQRPVL